MKILLISTAALTTPPQEYGGIELIVWWLADGLSQLGHEVAIVGLEGSTPPNDKVKVFILWSKQEAYAETLLADRFSTLLEHFKPDIISDHSHYKVVYPLAKKLGIPYVPTSHTIAIPDLGESKACWTALSKNHARWLNQKYGITAVPIYNGVRYLTPARTKWSEKSQRFIFVGRPNPEKGALEAIEYCKKRNLPLDVVAGRLKIEPVAYALWVAQECKWGSEIVYHGSVSHDRKFEMFSRARAFLNFPNWEEPFGLTVIESMWCGTPVITTDVGAMPELVEDKKTGFIIPVKRDEAGAPIKIFNPRGVERIDFDETLVDNALASLQQLDLQYIVQYARSKFSISRMANDYLKTFNDVLDGRVW
jgi:glycosyltransferase involved in cell wall biosynthesis